MMECFETFAGHHGISDAIRRRIKTIVDEILNNVISYAYEDDREHEITVRFEKANDRLIATFEDDGTPFNPLEHAVENIQTSIESRTPGGLGIHLVRKLSDEVTYHRHGDRNILTTFMLLDKGDPPPKG